MKLPLYITDPGYIELLAELPEELLAKESKRESPSIYQLSERVLLLVKFWMKPNYKSS